eukprot:m.21195 g.21195  ORF g.21195 m.21195 type:complete len:584 (-) comp3867_c0_seq1:71-1822(-)
MTDSYEWVEILEPDSGKKMYANVVSGDCVWEPPAGVPVKATHENQWWELVDTNTSRSYYYNASSHATVWERPRGGDIIPLAKLQQMQARLAEEEQQAAAGAGADNAVAATTSTNGAVDSTVAPAAEQKRVPPVPAERVSTSSAPRTSNASLPQRASTASVAPTSPGAPPPTAPAAPVTAATSVSPGRDREAKEKLEECEDLNQHKKGLFFKRPVSIATMLAWSKETIPSPMLMTIRKTHRKDAIDLFKLVQTAMGDRSARGRTFIDSATAIVDKTWSVNVLRDELYLQLCKQTTSNPSSKSEEAGWELIAICVTFFPPSTRFTSYLEGYICRHIKGDDKISQYAEHCIKKLDKVRQAGARRGNEAPSRAEVEVAQRNIFNPSLFGSTLEEVMEMQEKQKPGLEIPWIVTALAEEILRKKGAQTEGIFRVPGDSDAVNNLKVALDKFQMKDTYAEPHVPASALKLWFRELQEPLIAEEYYENCIGAANDADMAVATLELLPELNRKLLLYIIRFLQVVGQKENQPITKMSHDNLAMVWAPNFLRCPSDDPMVIFNNTKMEMQYVRHLVLHLNTDPVAHLGLEFH